MAENLTSLRDAAKNLGYVVDYNQANNQVSVNNPSSGKSINFTSGQGNNFGVGSFSNGTNYVTNLDSLKGALAAEQKSSPPAPTPNTGGKPQTTPATNQQQPYQSQYQNNINSTLNQIQNPNPYQSQQQGNINNTVNQIQNKQPYQSSYADQIAQVLQSVQNSKFNYNPNTDTALQAAQQQAQGKTVNEMARRNMVYSDTAKSRMAQVAMSLVPQYEQMAYGRYRDTLGDEYKKLDAYNTLDTKDYGKYRDNVNDQYKNVDMYNNLDNTAYGRYRDTLSDEFKKLQALSDIDNTMYGRFSNDRQYQASRDDVQSEKEFKMYGTELSPQARQNIQIFNNMPAEVQRVVQQYKGDYAAEINRRMALDPNDPLIPYLHAARNMKILGNASLMEQHGPDYGLSNPAIANQALGYETGKLTKEGIMSENTIKAAEAKIAEIRAKYAEPQIQKELEQIEVAIQTGKVELAIREIEKSSLSDQLKAELNRTIAETEDIKMGTAIKGKQLEAFNSAGREGGGGSGSGSGGGRKSSGGSSKKSSGKSSGSSKSSGGGSSGGSSSNTVDGIYNDIKNEAGGNSMTMRHMLSDPNLREEIDSKLGKTDSWQGVWSKLVDYEAGR